jgi:hypothetical protein
MNKHTPGPWEYQLVPTGVGAVACKIVSEKGLICTGRSFTSHGSRQASAEADADLIAAAPQMLEALHSAERCLAIYEREGANNAELLVVRAAIAKAEGE